MTTSPVAYLRVTPVCQLDCAHCYSAYDTFFELTPEKLRSCLHELYSNGITSLTIRWHGGEPLLLGVKKLFQLAEVVEASPIRIQNEIQTNLVLYTSEIATLFRDVFNSSINVSLDSNLRAFPGPLGNSQPYVLENIQRAIEDSIHVGVTFTVSKPFINEFDDLSKFFTFISAHNITDVRLEKLAPIGRAADNWDRISISNSEYSTWMIKLAEQYSILRSNASLSTTIQPLDGFFTTFEKDLETFPGCWSGKCCSEFYVISSEGLQNTCTALVSCDTLSKIQPLCQKCQYSRLCHGGCPASIGDSSECNGHFQLLQKIDTLTKERYEIFCYCSAKF